MTRTPQNYFNRFPKFQPDPHLLLDQEFERLATHQGWNKKTKQYKTERNSFLIAQFHAHLGSLEQSTRLEDWQALCQELRVESIPESIMQCKKVLSTKVHVNIVDLIDSRRQGTKVKVFKTRHALVSYTVATKKFFPKGEAKKNKLLKILLREIV